MTADVLPMVSIERTLAERAVAGDGRAFRAIYERNAPAVYRFLRDLLRDEEAAEEATQETFVRAHRGLGTVRDAERLLPWLLGIARNVFHETVRARRGHGVTVDDEELEVEPSAAPSPEGELLAREADRILDGALETLSPDRRAALLLLMDHDLSYGEIAETMGWSLAKVKVEIHRARLKLRAAVNGYLGGNS